MHLGTLAKYFHNFFFSCHPGNFWYHQIPGEKMELWKVWQLLYFWQKCSLPGFLLSRSLELVEIVTLSHIWNLTGLSASIFFLSLIKGLASCRQTDRQAHKHTHDWFDECENYLFHVGKIGRRPWLTGQSTAPFFHLPQPLEGFIPMERVIQGVSRIDLMM